MRIYTEPPCPGRYKLTDQERYFIRTDKITSKRLLAMQFNVAPRLIDFIQNPDKYTVNNEYMKAYRKQWRLLHPPKPRKKRVKKIKSAPLNEYEAQIHKLISEGVGVGDIDIKLNENLSQLVQNKIEIEKQIEEVRKTQNALYKYIDITPVTLDPEFVPRKNEEIVHMTSKDMKWSMTECGLTAKKLVEVLGKRYSVRAIQSYMGGQASVPRNVAELLRGYPRKTHLKVVP